MNVLEHCVCQKLGIMHDIYPMSLQDINDRISFAILEKPGFFTLSSVNRSLLTRYILNMNMYFKKQGSI